MEHFKTAFLFSVAITLCSLSANGQATDVQSVYAFSNVNVLPMDKEEVLTDQTIIVEGGRITEMGSSTSIEIPDEAKVIDGQGKFLMPGLAEMHGHVPPLDLPDSYPQSYVEDILFLYLAGGITTVRGMLGHEGQLELTRKINEGQLQGPSLYLAGPSFNGNTVSSPEQAARRVREQSEEGWYLLKIHPGLTLQEFDAVANTAQEEGIPFGGHIPEDVGLMHALEMNQQTIDHLDGYIRYLDAADKPISPEKLETAVKESKAAGTWVIPTMALWETLLGAADYNEMREYPELKYMPKVVLDDWNEALRNFESKDESEKKAARQEAENRLTLLKALHDGGVPVLMGTDSHQIYSVPGFSLLRELELMKEAGLSNYEILATGTANVGKYFGEEEFGTVAPGQRADLLLLDGNPLEDLKYLQGFPGLMVRGQWITKEQMDKRLRDIESHTQLDSTDHDLTTIDGIINALYASISGEKGVERDWKTFRMLFKEDAKLIPAGINEQGDATIRYWTPEDYIEQSGPWLVENGFIEEEIHRETDRFDPIAHVFSTYTSRNTKGGELIARGINSIQLLNDGKRWWVVNIYWAGESEERPVPKEYDN
jgi:imidazolonepropionase-like amidohydrolase